MDISEVSCDFHFPGDCGDPTIDFIVKDVDGRVQNVASSALIAPKYAGGSAYVEGKADSDGRWEVGGGIKIDF